MPVARRRQRFIDRRKTVGLSQEQLAQAVGVDRTTAGRWETAESTPHPVQRPRLARALDVSIEHLQDLLLDVIDLPNNDEHAAVAEVKVDESGTSVSNEGIPDNGSVAFETSDRPLTLTRLKLLRESVDEAVSGSAMSEASLEDWEETALRLGAATRYRSSAPLLVELTNDFFELQLKLARRQPLSALRRLTIVTAQMAGLMSLTLLKLNENAESRHWARTARVAADESGDLTVSSWVRAQEAYAHYYAGSLSAAIHVARKAQAVAGDKPCVGVALAAALEARAHAGLGRSEETLGALRRAEETLAWLDPESVRPSAFGYDEAQLRFHEGNAFTHLRDTEAAWRAQERALALYPQSDYTDRTLTWLDRASCVAYDGDTSGAMKQATDALVRLTDQQRSGLITLRGGQVLDQLPEKQRSLPAVREFRDLLMLTMQEKDDS
jgi:transcriptional regulator with XRE-family HTH domain